MAQVAPPARLVSIDDALAQVLERTRRLAAAEVALDDAYGRFLAEDVVAAIDLPPFDSSAMDGYAVRAASTPGRLTVVGESAAGAPYGCALAAGEAVAISTGAIVPAGADAVVPVEDTDGGGDEVEIGAAAAPGAFVRRRGSDVVRGAPLLGAGTRVGPAQLGAAAAIGRSTLCCRRRPRVAILTTGDELRQPGESLGPGDIYDANRPLLHAALRTAGAEVSHVSVAADTMEAHRAAMAQALEHDVVISSGGVSVGPHDLVRGVAAELGVEEIFWRIALRPGKPLTFGIRGDALVFGLPGNPVSTLVCFELFVRPALLALQGAVDPRPAYRTAFLGAAVPRNATRDELVRARLEILPGELPVATALIGQESHQIAVAAQADALVRVPAGGGEVAAGTPVSYLPVHTY